jgi:peptidase S24-like protein
MMTETVHLIQSGNLKITPFLSFVCASFPSPADDYKERPLDLDELVIQHPEATFYVKVSGEPMQDAGIDDSDVLVVDRAIDASHNAIIVAVLNQVWGVVTYCIRKVNDPRLKRGGLCLSSTATRNIFADVPLWLHRLTHQGQSTSAPFLPSLAEQEAFAS